MTSPEEQELKFSLSVEGSASHQRMSQLISTITQLVTEAHIQVNIVEEGLSEQETEEPPITTFTKEDFRNNWNPQGAGHAWRRLLTIADTNEDLPIILRSPNDIPVVDGNLDEILEWLHDNPQKGTGSGILKTILQKMNETLGA